MWPKKGETGEDQSQQHVHLFFDIKMIVHKELVLAGQTINYAYYCGVSRRLRGNVWRLRPELWRQKKWLLHHDSAPPHTSLFTRDFLYQTQHDCRPPTHPDFLFPRLTIQLKDRHLDTVENRRRCWTASQNTTSRMHLKTARALGTAILAEGDLMVTIRSKASFWPDVSSSPENYYWLLYASSKSIFFITNNLYVDV
jgi:hypothetical protein